MKTAICPGSFDPVTKGHVDIIERACRLFDRIIVLVALNPAKTYCFSVQERVLLIQKSTGHLPQVEVDVFSGLLASYVESVQACAIVKGLRAMSDFEYEFQQALANKRLQSNAETVFLTTAAENMFLSSSLVKEVATLGGDITGLVPQQIAHRIADRLTKDPSVSSVRQ